MGEHLLKNWIVYVMLGGFMYFVAYLLITSRKQEKKEEKQNKMQEKK